MIASLSLLRSGVPALLAALLGGTLALPAQTTPPASPVAGHLVGTILGQPETRGLSDFRTDADLLEVTDFAFLPNGEMLVSDAIQNRVFLVGPDGILRLFAGTGSAITSGDGGLATAAGVQRPAHLAVTGNGDVFIATDRTDRSIIRKVAPDGVIQVFAGDGGAECPVLGATAASAPIGRVTAMAASGDGTLYFFSSGCQRVFSVGADGLIGLAGVPAGSTPPAQQPGVYPGVSAANVGFSSVDALAVDVAGNVNVAASFTPTIVRITTSGVAINVSAAPGTGVRQGALQNVELVRRLSLAAFPQGGLAIVQTDTATLGRAELGVASATDDYSIVFAQDGHDNKPQPSFQGFRINPDRVRVSPLGGAFIRDSFSQSVFQVSPSGALTHYLRAFRRAERTILEGDPPLLRTNSITNLVTDADGNVYFGDPVLHRIYRLGADGILTRIAGSGVTGALGDGGPALNATLFLGSRIAIDSQKRLYFLTNDSQRLRRFTIGGNIETILGGGQNFQLGEGNNANDAILQSPVVWAVSPNGEVYFHQQTLSIHRIWKVTADGKLARFAGGGSSPLGTPLSGLVALDALLGARPSFIEVDSAGTVFFQLQIASGIYRVDDQGIIRTVVGETGNSTTTTDGAPTLTAPQFINPPLSSPAPGTLYALVGFPGALAEYVADANIRVLRRSDTGTPRNDGGFLGDDMLVQQRSLAPMPGGGLVWSEWGNNLVTIRRSFPVPQGCTYTVNATELPVSGTNSLSNINLTTGADCPWTVGTSANWLKILTRRTGKGGTTVQLNALANPSPTPRSGLVRIAGKEVVVNQAASTRTDIFFVSPSAATVPSAGGSVTVSIVASPQQSWQISLPSSPVGFEGSAAGNGSAQFTVTIPTLPAGTVSRTLTVGVNAAAVAITQTTSATPVLFTLSANIPGMTALVDLVPRTLPFQAQWIPGSTHLVSVSPIAEANANTRIQFRGWPDGATDLGRILLAPTAASTVNLAFRRLHRLSTITNLGSLPNAPWLAFSNAGEPMPAEFPSPPALDGTRYEWFPEGGTVQVFAPNRDGLRFANFTGAVSSSDNPVTVTMDQPRQLLASYTQGNTLLRDLQIGGAAVWRFPDDSRVANPAQISVSFTNGASTAPSRFVSYQNPGGTVDWLQIRASGGQPPYTLELGLDPARAAGDPSIAAVVYFHRPDADTVSTTARYSLLDPVTGDDPRITAITDAGGFRQAVLDLGYLQTSLVAAPGMILTLFGENLAAESGSASAVPLPLNLAGTSVERWRFQEQDWVPVPLFYVSPGQINFQLPPDLSVLENQEEEIRLRVRRGATMSVNETRVMLRNRSVSLFSANSSGAGAPAGFAVRVRASGEQERSNLFLCGNGQCTPNAAPMGGTGDELFLELFGTGFRNRGAATQMKAFVGTAEAEISFAGPHPTFVGLDQVNVKVPRDTPRGQDIDLYIWVRNGTAPWIASNRLTVRFQ
ncbi:MAG: hypothetical protein KIT83_02195 [Bryobacterales bacterium]|nr:hypothetical protein [Bryobacterales bacterium]